MREFRILGYGGFSSLATKILIILALLAGCVSESDQNQIEASGDEISFALPMPVREKTPLPSSVTVVGSVEIVELGIRRNLEIDGDQARATIASIPVGSYTIRIQFIAQTPQWGDVTLAQASQPIDIGAGSNGVSFTNENYLPLPDDDNDSIDNITEIRIGTNPFVADQPTNVGGIVSSNTTWNLINSPYFITSDVSIAYGITLQIDADVKIIGNNGNIKVFGILDSKGTDNAKIKFDNVNIVPGGGLTNEWFRINIDYAEVSSGSIYSPTGNSGYGSISLRNSVLTNIEYMYLWYPKEDCFIEKNLFINSGGISVGHSDNIKVYVRNNAFYQSTDDYGQEYAIKNWASYDTSETIVEYNSFLNTDRIALMLPGGYTSANITAINNYWNTTDTVIIEAMIYDKNDDLSSSDYITYSPFLSEPDPNTPDITSYVP